MNARRAFLLLLAAAAIALGAILTFTLDRPSTPKGEGGRAIARTSLASAAQAVDEEAELAAPRSASSSGTARVTEAPAAGPAEGSYGLGDLRSLDAILLHAKSKQRAPHRRVALFDENGVRVDATSDAAGRIVAHDLLLAGKVRLSTRPLEVPWTPSPDELRRLDVFASDKGIHAVDHTGGANGDPDVWAVDLDTRLGLAYAGTATTEARRFAFVTAKTTSTYAELKPQRETRSPGLEGLTELIVIPIDCHVPAWRAREIDATLDERKLVVVEAHRGKLKAGEAIVATVDLERVSIAYAPLLPLLETDGPSLEARFGPKLGKRIGQLVADENAQHQKRLAAEFTGISIRGSIASQSGTFREPIKIQARPARDETMGPDRLTRTGIATVEWDDEGRGTFHIQNLDTGRYELRPVGSSVPLARPEHVVVAAPSDQRGRPLFTVLDEHRTWPVAVRASDADGTWIGGFRAKIEAPFGGRVLRGGVVAPFVFDQKQIPPGAIVLSQVPEGSEFRVDVSLRGYRSTTLHWNDFALEGGRLVATAVLFEGEDPIGSGR
ncbi:MAG: hypothetical protein AAGB93_09385 [Planctomycetota bacterium]